MNNKESIFSDYGYDASSTKPIMKIKNFLNAFVVPCNPNRKICPWIRLAIKAEQNNHRLLRRILDWILFKKFQFLLGSKCDIGENIIFPHPMGIVIGHTVKIGKNCVIYHQVTLGQNKGCFPQIGDNVVIFAGAKVVGDVKVGNNVIIGTNAVVTRDIPSNSIVAGNPAVVIKKVSDISEYKAW